MTSIGPIACALPERALTNADLERENPSWNMAAVTLRTGVLSRRIASAGETAFDLSARACEALVAESGVDLGAIDAILYCTQTPDYPMPGNAHLLHRELQLGADVLAFDYNLACSGYVYGLAFVDSFVRSGLAAQILLVTAETYSKRIHPGDRSARALFGDGAAVTHITAGDDGGGRIVAVQLGSHGAGFQLFHVPAGGARNPSDEGTRQEQRDRHGRARSAETIQMDGTAVWGFANSIVPEHLRAFLASQSLTFEDVDLCVFHQASKLTLDSLAEALDLPPDKLYVHLADTGNLSSASIPFALRAALADGAIGPGDRVLLSGFGAGLSYGSVLVEF